jgi:ATP-binding cassette subfamily B protein
MIRFNDLSYRYPGQHNDALKGVSFSVEAGQTMALVGRVGSGKTTLLQSIPRLYNIPKGTVFIDDVDIAGLHLKTLRSGIGFVTQESIIFSDTVRNNVIFGRTPIAEESLESALKAAQIYDDVLHLEQGLDTLLGERGITLSGGQRQRLTIARALIADPPILILDDALSMVDTRTEETILNQILSMRSAKTNLIVSHRISTIRRADLIVVLNSGEVVELGDHDTLLARGMEYAKLYERQLLASELETETNDVR